MCGAGVRAWVAHARVRDNPDDLDGLHALSRSAAVQQSSVSRDTGGAAADDRPERRALLAGCALVRRPRSGFGMADLAVEDRDLDRIFLRCAAENQPAISLGGD